MQLAQDKVIITESGILDTNAVQTMNAQGVYGFLVGEAFMKKDDIVSEFQTLFNSEI
jgi:indole-3-glycerol phosphate synthase